MPKALPKHSRVFLIRASNTNSGSSRIVSCAWVLQTKEIHGVFFLVLFLVSIVFWVRRSVSDGDVGPVRDLISKSVLCNLDHTTCRDVVAGIETLFFWEQSRQSKNECSVTLVWTNCRMCFWFEKEETGRGESVARRSYQKKIHVVCGYGLRDRLRWRRIGSRTVFDIHRSKQRLSYFDIVSPSTHTLATKSMTGAGQ